MKARRLWAWPLVPLYWGVVRGKHLLRRAGVLRTRRLQAPVVSVGSVSAGGAGKTPVVLALADLLGARGWRVDVLSRGYGRAGQRIERVDPAATDAASRFGDEPVLLARRTGVPVWVGAQRYPAGVAAEAAAAPGPRVHLLDDGFQHRQLARAVDLVLVTAEDLRDALLPAGNRREPLSALLRADAVIVREQERAGLLPSLTGLLRPGVPVWTIRRELSFAHTVPGLLSAGCVVFSAIARPDDFHAMLQRVEVRVLAAMVFHDHHAYTEKDISRLIAAARAAEAHRFVTTEKDAVKLTPALRAQLEAVAPVVVARLGVVFAEEAAVLDFVEARLR